MDNSEQATVPSSVVVPVRRHRPRLGEVMEAEALVSYLERVRQRGTLSAYRDRVTVRNGLGEERFDLVQLVQGVRWRRTR